MQEDETNALRKLDRYQSILQELVLEKDVEIVKSYEDGSICLFPSAEGAVECACKISLRSSRGQFTEVIKDFVEFFRLLSADQNALTFLRNNL